MFSSASLFFSVCSFERWESTFAFDSSAVVFAAAWSALNARSAALSVSILVEVSSFISAVALALCDASSTVSANAPLLQEAIPMPASHAKSREDAMHALANRHAIQRNAAEKLFVRAICFRLCARCLVVVITIHRFLLSFSTVGQSVKPERQLTCRSGDPIGAE